MREYYEEKNDENIKYNLVIDSDGKRKMLLALIGGEKFKEEKTNNVHVLKNSSFLKSKTGIAGVFIEILLINPEKTPYLYNGFNNFCVLILSKIKYDKKSNYEAVKEAVQEYRSLLSKTRDKLLGDEQIVGLLGELYVAEKVTRVNEQAFDNWKGPDALRHDFRRNNISIEVKSQKLRDENTCTINGIEQLVAPEDAELYFVHCVFEQDDQGVSIPDMKERLEDLGVPPSELEQKLNDADFDYSQIEKYRDPKRKFKLVRMEYYLVDDSFPKITPASFIDNQVPDSVTEVRYKINLVTARPLEDGAADRMLQDFCI